jgi:flavin-dependent dehydrogenase
MRNRKPKIAVVGAGPAGSSLAIRLSLAGFETVLIEREKFPRPKLCGEFISPECFAHFRALGALEEMFSAGGERIAETVFYAPNGKSVAVPSAWFGAADEAALGLSRAAMDDVLMKRAARAGARILENVPVVEVLTEDGKVFGVKTRRKNGETEEITADLTIDAAGRAGVLARLLEKRSGDGRREDGRRGGEEENNEQRTKDQRPKTKDQRPKTKDQRPNHIAFKAHFENAALETGRCEIYFFRGGYAGLGRVENGLFNLCFLIEARRVKEFRSDAGRIIEEVIFQNAQARRSLGGAKPVSDWLAVSIDRFGAKNLVPAENLLAVGDAAAFIDPFTGSGMLTAFESAEILARSIAENYFSFGELARRYRKAHRRSFRRRLLVCDLMRRAAFVPNFAGLVISALSFSDSSRRFLARATRPKAGS